MTPVDLDAIEARLAAATIPPWYSPSERDAQDRDPHNVYVGDTIGIVASAIFKSDADLIAHAPTDLAALLVELRATTSDLAVAVEVARERGEEIERLSRRLGMTRDNAAEADRFLDAMQGVRTIPWPPRRDLKRAIVHAIERNGGLSADTIARAVLDAIGGAGDE